MSAHCRILLPPRGVEFTKSLASVCDTRSLWPKRCKRQGSNSARGHRAIYERILVDCCFPGFLRSQNKYRKYRIIGYFSSVFGIFRYLKYRRRYLYRFFKPRYRFGIRYTDPWLTWPWNDSLKLIESQMLLHFRKLTSFLRLMRNLAVVCLNKCKPCSMWLTPKQFTEKSYILMYPKICSQVDTEST